LFCEYPTQACLSPGRSTFASCVNGRWLIGQSDPSMCQPAYEPMPLPCPVAPPVSGEPCPLGSFTTSICSYPSPMCPSALAYCDSGIWVFADCAPVELGGAGGEGGERSLGEAGQPYGGRATSLGGAAGSED
jgi:hypothetical protein